MGEKEAPTAVGVQIGETAGVPVGALLGGKASKKYVGAGEFLGVGCPLGVVVFTAINTEGDNEGAEVGA